MNRLRIPDSISAMVYRMGWPWTLMVWGIAACGFAAMMSVDGLPDYMYGIGFAASACVAFVGAMPLVPGSHNTLHWSFGIAACVLSQLWTVLACVIIGSGWQALAIVLLSVVAAAYFTGTLRRSWCFWLELWCIAAVAVVRVVIYKGIDI